MLTPLPRQRFFEIIPACLFAGCGMICAGSFVDWVKFHYANEFDPLLLAAIPPLIGLKGNLEITLSSRLATAVNLKTEINCYTVQIFVTTLVYILLQGLSASVIVSILCWGLHTPWSASDSHLTLVHLSTISVLTCTLSICALSIMIFLLIIGCLKLGVDPDNVAPPVAAALGDLGTVTVLLFTNRCSLHSPFSATFLALTLFATVLGAGFCCLGCSTLPTSEVQSLSITSGTLISSIVPLLGAVAMSSLSGQILARFSYLPNLARLQIAINGVGGCFGSIVVSRMLTSIHATHSFRLQPLHHSCKSSGEFIDSDSQTTSDQTLTLAHRHYAGTVSSSSSTYLPSERAMSNVGDETDSVLKLILFSCIPVHLILALVSLLLLGVFSEKSGDTSEYVFTFKTVCAYVSAGFLQVFTVLLFAKWIVLVSWRHALCAGHSFPWLSCISLTNVDQPSLFSLDLTCIALTTGLGDLVGSVLLTSCLYYFQADNL